MSLLPKRPGPPLTYPVDITIGIALPGLSRKDPPPQDHTALHPAAIMPTISFPDAPNGNISGRDQFIRRMLMAEAVPCKA